MTLDRGKFEALRDDLLTKRADIDRALDSLNVLLADDLLISPQIVVHATPVAKPAPARLNAAPPKRIAPAKTAQPESPAADDAKTRAKALFMEHTKAIEIARQVGRKIEVIYQWASDGKWRIEREKLNGTKPTNGTKHLRTADELRAERKARDDQIIEDVRQRNEEEQRTDRKERARSHHEFSRNGGLE